MDVIRDMIVQRNKKAQQMNINFEPTQRINAYKAASKQTILDTYRTVLDKTRQELLKNESRIKEKYAREPMTLQELNSMAVRVAAMGTKQLLKDAESIISSNLPCDPDKALLIARELRNRNVTDNADTLALHVTGYLDCPWIRDPEWEAVQRMKGRLTTYEAQSKDPEGMIVLDFGEHPRRDSVIPINRFDEIGMDE
jgi:hypothetical protein